MKKLIYIFVMVMLVSGCASLGHMEFYNQVAPIRYPPPEKTMVFDYNNVNLKEIYDLLFSDFLIIGRSGFNGPYENPTRSVLFAKSIGADVFLSSSQFKETRTSFMNLSTPTSSTTYMSGYSGTGSFYGTATTYGTQTTTVPIRIDRYDQDGLFLRNVNSVVPLWERKIQDYKKTGSSALEGTWYNEDYKIDIYKSGEQMVGFIISRPKERQVWDVGALKMIFGESSGVGVYLMGNKTPVPAKFKINKFGNLEVTLFTGDASFSFARILEAVKSETEDNSIDRKKRNAREHFEKGVAYLDAKDAGKAIFELNKAAELDPDDVMIHMFLGDAFMNQKNYDNAILEFNQVTKLDPKEILAYLERSSAYVLSDDYDQAILECNKAITIDPNSAEAYDLRGIIYGKQKKYVESLADIERAKKLGFNEDEKRIEDLRNKIKQKQ